MHHQRNDFDRRQVLGGFLGLGAGASGVLGGPRFWWDAHQDPQAPSSEDRTLVVVFLRGGIDGLNWIVPYSDPNYARLRGSIALGEPGTGNGVLPIDETFGWHPACAPLATLMEAGHLAAIHAVGHPENTRSHFEEQDRFETVLDAAPVGAAGWLSRLMQSTPGHGPLRAVSLGTSVPRSMRGPDPAMVIQRLADYAGEGASPAMVEALRAMYSAQAQGIAGQVQENAQAALAALDRLGQVARNPFEPKGNYPAQPIGERLREVAHLVHARLGTEVIQLDYSGFDTHQNQPQALQQRLLPLAQGLAALQSDLGEERKRVMVLLVSEFGRTARANGTRGTDHGSGNCVVAMGAGLKARGVIGDWPTLERKHLHEDRDLAVTTDIRNVYAEVAQRFFGIENVEPVLPGWSPQPIGLLG